MVNIPYAFTRANELITSVHGVSRGTEGGAPGGTSKGAAFWRTKKEEEKAEKKTKKEKEKIIIAYRPS